MTADPAKRSGVSIKATWAARTAAKARAARINGRRGGRPREHSCGLVTLVKQALLRMTASL